MQILVIDNYDSFTYNLVYLLRQQEKIKKLSILRNDKVTPEDIHAHDKILLSPGPGIPSEAGKMQEILADYHNSKSILGICLGHQGMGEAFGCKLENMEEVLHGFQDEINIDTRDYLFTGLEPRITCGRYHSWRIKLSTFKDKELEVIATDDKGEIMGIRHKKFDLRGLQFHPESIMTTTGSEMIGNWVRF